MPTHCCVPDCTKKGYRDDEGAKISFFIFPKDSSLRKRWIHAIRRDEGRNFSIKESTKVCSRHFRAYDFRKSLAGKTLLQPNAVPSVFSWTRSSPRKRKPPMKRFTASHASMSIDESIEDLGEVEEVNLQSCEVACQIKANTLEVGTQTDENFDDGKRKIQCLEQAIKELELKVVSLEKEIDFHQKRVFSFDTIKELDSSAPFYTGFENWETFMAVYRYLNPGTKGENIEYWRASSTTIISDYDEDNDDSATESLSKMGRARKLTPLNELFLVFCRLRQGFHEEHLAHLFHVSVSTISRILITWINFMYFKFGQIKIWPSKESILENMPEDFKVKYSSTRVIIDCTEVRCQMPGSLHLNSELFSSYKNHTTLKGLIGISPSGQITFISQLYTGSISDKEIVMRSGLLDLPFADGDSVMADKGFTISDVLPIGVSLNIPPFLESRSQMSPAEVVQTQEIASLRIHVERAINKIKNFHVWDRVIPIHQFGIVNQMWAVCSFLCNAQPNIISI